MTMRADQSHAARRGGAGGPRRSRQRGSVAVMATIWALVAIIVLGAIDVGHFYAERRRMQAAADLAALSAVSQITTDSTCQAAKTAAGQIANPSKNPLPT